MFLVNRIKNEAISLEKKSFQELGFKERRHLQEWICKNPDMLGEELLIIQKEFSGFDDTKEQLDLLALDKSGSLVIIENKLDDTGRDVTWQALKYVSYCSGLSKLDIRDIFQKYIDKQGQNENAEQIIFDFLKEVGFNDQKAEDFSEVEINNEDQRIILVAASFRKEVTSTVMWLLEHNVKIKCIKVTPYMLNENVLIDTEQIIPVKDAEEYLIKLAIKKQVEFMIKDKNQTRYNVRFEFWTKLLQKMKEQSVLFININPSTDNWISCGCGHNGLAYEFAVTGNHAKIGLWINKGTKEENKLIFDNIHSHKTQIESAFGNELEWQKLDDNKGSRIAFIMRDVSVFNEDDWDKMIQFMTQNMIKFEKSMKDVLAEVLKARKYNN
jgi:hypothetical protein